MNMQNIFKQTYLRNLRSLFYSTLINESKMEDLKLLPPSCVKNMTSLNRDAFNKVVALPSITVHIDNLQNVLKKSKKYLVKLSKFNSIIIPHENDEMRCILFDPSLILDSDDIQTKIGIDLLDIDGKFSMTKINLKYENWKPEQIFKAIFSDETEPPSSYSIIGHILHLNLREHLIPYKKLIAQVYLDKTPNVSLVVNKADIIDNADNTFRTFALEKLAGNTESTVTSVKENNCIYTFDFSKVYWNSRLSMEHERIIHKLKSGDVLFDVMAGVGPFAIPIGKKKCLVFANDLNPSSYEALIENCKKNKVSNQIECFNMDGNDFIRTIFRDKYNEISEDGITRSIHITMNLPSIAIEFLPAFIGLYSNLPNIHNKLNETHKLPIVHVYLFSFNETKEYAIHSVASKLGYCHKELIFAKEQQKSINTQIIAENIQTKFLDQVLEVVNVRRVAPAKVMFRVSFRLLKEILTRKIDEIDLQCRSPKRLKV